MEKRPRSNEYRMTMVCVDSYDDGLLSGRFYNPYYQEGVPFQNLMQFLLRMENMLDNMNFPQSFTTARSFAALPDRGPRPSVENQEKRGKVGTFAIRVLFRQNTSWQGSVTWLEGSREENFRSALELVLLINSALGMN